MSNYGQTKPAAPLAQAESDVMYNENTHNEQDQMVNLTDAAGLCGYKSRQSLYHLLSKGEGPPHVIVAGHRFFNRQQLKVWAETHRKRRGKNGHHRQEG